MIIALTSNNTAQATVVSSVLIPAGQTSATFAINAVDNGIVDSGNSVTITASAPGSGYTLGTATLTVTNTDVANTLMVSLNPATVLKGGTATGTVILSTASSTPTTVTLVSSNTAEAVLTNSTVTIAAGSLSGSFTVTAVQDGIVTGNESVTITAQTSGYTTGTASLAIDDNNVAKALTVQLSPTTIAENDGAKASTGTVTVSVAPTSDLVVTLTSSNNAQATVDATTTILAGHTSATFSINAVDDGIAETSANSVTITASAPGSGYTLGTATLTVTNTDVAKTLTVTLSPADDFGGRRQQCGHGHGDRGCGAHLGLSHQPHQQQ